MFEVRTCEACGAWQSYARPVCTLCHGRSFFQAGLPLRGEIYSLTVVQRAPAPQFAADVPYTIGLIRGPSGGLLMLQLHDFPTTPGIGDPVWIEEAGDAAVARPRRTE
jgi:uncharacterized OB-fold protein